MDVGLLERANGFAIVCEVTHCSRASLYIQQKYLTAGKFEALPPTKDGVLAFVRSDEISNLTAPSSLWIQEILLDLFQDPIVLRVFHRAFPIHVAFSKIDELYHPDNLAAMNSVLNSHPNGSVRLQCFPREIQALITPHLPLKFHPKDFTHVLNVAQYKDRFFCSFSDAKTYWSKDSAMWKPETMGGNLTTAYRKISEVMLRYKLNIGNSVLDIGASPGGWTCFFAEQCEKVTAVDPAELDPTVKALKNVVHIKLKLDECIHQFEKQSFDIIVCDMCGHGPEGPVGCIEMMNSVVDLLKPGGALVWTLKLMRRKETSEAQAKLLRKFRLKAEEVFGAKFSMIDIVWLLANKNERTLVASGRK